jgi:hypothetical protein
MEVSCKEIIREDENFYTIKINCTSDLSKKLIDLGIKWVYKGDQNLLWDALITDLVVYNNLKDKLPFIPFVHDEKLGTGDHRLIPFYKNPGRYTLTEDYAGKLTGAVYINQDISYGLLYGVPIEPSDYNDLNFKLLWLAKDWGKYKDIIKQDGNFIRSLADFGFSLDYENYSIFTGSGLMANRETLTSYFQRNPKAEIYYLFSKSLGWYGIVPRYPEEISLSSIYFNDELLRYLKTLFILGLRGTLRQVKNKEKRRGILERARKIYNWAKEILKEQNITIADFQVKLAEKIVKDISEDYNLSFQRTSDILKIASYEDLKNKDFYYFFDLLLKYPIVFSQAYNSALNKARLPLKRILIKENTFQPPYFLEIFNFQGDRKILVRCNLEIKNKERPYIMLSSPHCKSFVLMSKENLISAETFLKTLYYSGKFPYGFALIGKAGPFMAEMRRHPRVLAVPEEGSKYAPMVDYFLGELNSYLKNIPDSHLIRIRINLLDNLDKIDLDLQVPKFLEVYLGKKIINSKEFSKIWKNKVEQVSKVLEVIKGLESGEYFHLANFILYEKGYMVDLGRSVKLIKKLEAKGYDGIFKNFPFPKSFLSTVYELLNERKKIIERIKEKKAEAPRELFELRDFIEYKVLFLFGVLIRSLLIFKKSLQYLNYRPYSIILYLISPEFIKDLIRNSEIYLERVEFKT